MRLAPNPAVPSESLGPEIHSFVGMPAVFASAQMQRLLDTVARIAASNASVLITGETGSGKEVVARAIHHYSKRKSHSLVDVNCAAFPQHLLESELFGYERGAFTGAEGTKPGMFELAEGGTLFLDEIGELDLAMQVKLLRALDGAPYYRLGGTKKIKVDVRIVTATNVDLVKAVDKGVFRRDLFHRLEQVRIDVPPLRTRIDDITALAEYFLSMEAPHLHFSKRALEALERYAWPGNVREVRNVVMRAVCMAPGSEIGLPDLPETFHSGSGSQPLPDSTIEELEQKAIFHALSQSGGKQERAAQMLGISKRTLVRKLKAYRASYCPSHS